MVAPLTVAAPQNPAAFGYCLFDFVAFLCFTKGKDILQTMAITLISYHYFSFASQDDLIRVELLMAWRVDRLVATIEACAFGCRRSREWVGRIRRRRWHCEHWHSGALRLTSHWL